ncbi:MAG TPA: DUF308 domain-containing protein [Caulobacteraceae bacterium]|nr:DUF308 domain-containing protein [Caulobacteraceae bacterium]
MSQTTFEAQRRAEASESMSEALAHSWWAMALRGIAAVVFGLAAVAAPAASLVSLVLVFAGYMFADGLFALIGTVQAARHNGHWGLMGLLALADFAAAAVTVISPGITVLAFGLLIGAWAFAAGVFCLIGAVRLHQDHGRLWLALGGAAAVVFGVLMLLAPMAGAVVLTWELGVFALAFGVLQLLLAWRLRPHRHERHPHHVHPLSA